ncbi:LysE family translocator [Oceanospirillum sediminis]|uniref:LysE family translocator n=1 Tax=Oceanospirillum sediminis TaxID=2760088 RepID=A0A839IL64_9GAMM|nr:LysE family translocator [Oceanospirillum sediminis]MBB1486133.1 LysE family translocator [Oceanospirillum sediminis]
MDFYIWLTFAAAALGLSITPGPNSLLALTHGVTYGYRRTCFTILGGVLGFLILFAISVAGLGLLLQSSPLALTLCKIFGSLYLAWLGMQLWRKPFTGIEQTGTEPLRSKSQLFRQGVLVALSNPKVILFLGVFLAMFIDTSQPLENQFITMALTLVIIEFVVELLVAMAAFKARPWLQKKGQQFNQLCGSLFIALAVILPFSQ